MIKIDGIEVPSLGKFEAEWALAKLMQSPAMSMAHLTVIVATHFDEDTRTAAGYARVAFDRLNAALGLVWSFDDMNIGRIKPDGKSLTTRDIERPAGLYRAEWYQFASDVCRLLNGPSKLTGDELRSVV